MFSKLHLKIKASDFSSEAKKHQGSLKGAILMHSSHAMGGEGMYK